MIDSQKYLDHFDYSQLYIQLLDAGRTAFTAIQKMAQDEDFYVFALFTAGAYRYVCVTANTEQGLTRTAEAYLRKDKTREERFYEGVTLDEMRNRLRHSPADSLYHCPATYDALFKQVNEKLHERSDAIFEVWSALSSEHGHHQASELTRHYGEELITVFLKVLQKLEQEGSFASDATRDSFMLNILMGDQDSSYIRFADILNPASVYERFLEEIGDV